MLFSYFKKISCVVVLTQWFPALFCLMTWVDDLSTPSSPLFDSISPQWLWLMFGCMWFHTGCRVHGIVDIFFFVVFSYGSLCLVCICTFTTWQELDDTFVSFWLFTHSQWQLLQLTEVGGRLRPLYPQTAIVQVIVAINILKISLTPFLQYVYFPSKHTYVDMLYQIIMSTLWIPQFAISWATLQNPPW